MLTAIDQYRTLRREALTAAFLAKQRIQSTRRNVPRTKIVLPLTLQIDEWETDTWTAELSGGGCAFMLNRHPTQEQLRVSIEVARGVIMRGDARVVGVIPRDGRYYVCVRFMALSDEARTMLEDIVLNTLLTAEGAL